MKHILYLIVAILISGCCPSKEYFDQEFKNIEWNHKNISEKITIYGKVFSESRNGKFGIIKIDVTTGDNTHGFLFLDPDSKFDNGDFVKFMPANYNLDGKILGYAINIESITEFKYKDHINYNILTNLDLHGMFDHHDQNHVRGHVNNNSITLLRNQLRPLKIAEIDNKEFAFYATFDPLGCSVDSVFYIPSPDSISNNNIKIPLIREIACDHESLHH